ncbi:protein tyrosine/serine phosphatase [Jatrophihabitans sp. GAS493]|uniref:tyrosine-protein phosphatase n=1 Tax=Jatrophihabitans sp. GAS493 TaxID=1907575 RepID=UPI000BBF8BD4|nr:tyrosine-protein phosphatase [Jatrophihabitans sp. GAS493]SOD71359.1 protein tyrosine/serine phosphatase [Jatrophihabitans sp. GAS493]
MPQWIDLDGAVNVRDVGGMTTTGGRRVRSRRLIRSDNLQDLSPKDLRLLIEDLGVRAVSDLRTSDEVGAEGPGPMTRQPGVLIEHNSLFSEAGQNTDAAAAEDSADEIDPVEAALTAADPVLLPWQIRDSHHDYANRGAVDVYWRYLLDRPDSIVASLRLIGRTDGAVIVHCAAGKDRTGVVVAMALAALGVEPEQIVADFALTADRIELIFARLGASPTYARDVADGEIDKHRPRAETMRSLLRRLDEEVGGASGWLAGHGWSEIDQSALEAALLE